MSEYGLKIKNFEAASIYEYQNGFRNRLDETNAMLTNSLFLDFLTECGISVYKGESTRDVICIAFGYGTKDYEKTMAKLNAIENPSENIEQLKKSIEANKDKCIKITKQDLRTKYYTEGVDITYRNLKKEETIHYKMLYRTPGKAKKGTCMFIRDELYDKAHEFLYMGLTLPEHNSPIVQMGAYSSLITSSVVGRVQIRPEEILVLNDVEVPFTTNVVIVGTDDDKHCTVKDVDNYELINTIFDGQALIDSSIFPEWADGYVLLRHHMTKCAAFNTNIELFMREHFGDEYEAATVKDMWGRDVRVKDIKLITTNNAMKWITFGVTFDYWAEWVEKNDSLWGIVKTTHESKLGNVQRMSYQMVNALDIKSMPEVVSTTVNYINQLKSNDEVFLDYLRKNTNFSNDYEVLVALVEHNPDFIRSEYFRDRKRKIIESYCLNFKAGRSIQNADNLTIVGSPYAMLLHSVGEDVYSDPTFSVEQGTIQCWTARFNDGEYLAEFRSPFNSRNNLGYIHNVYHSYFDKYFKFGKLVIAVNMIGTDWQDRNNGADQDSDSCYTTNQIDIVNHAKYCYENYATIVNKIPKQKNEYDYTMKDFAKVDNKLAAAQLAIGESSNLAQLCLTYTYNYTDKKYTDYVCALSVLAQIAIDNAKRTFDIDLVNEIKFIKQDSNIENNGLPKFWQVTKKDKTKSHSDEERKEKNKKNKEKIRARLNKELICPMNYVYDLELNKYRDSSSTLPMSEFFINHIQDNDRRKSKKVEELIEKYSIDLYEYNVNNKENWEEDIDSVIILRSDFENLIKDIQQIYISKNYLGLMSWLINRAFQITEQTRGNMNSVISKNKSLLLKVLYDVNSEAFLKCFKKV